MTRWMLYAAMLFLFNNCVGNQGNCTYTQVSLLRDTTAVRKQWFARTCIDLTSRMSLYQVSLQREITVPEGLMLRDGAATQGPMPFVWTVKFHHKMLQEADSSLCSCTWQLESSYQHFNEAQENATMAVRNLEKLKTVSACPFWQKAKGLFHIICS